MHEAAVRPDADGDFTVDFATDLLGGPDALIDLDRYDDDGRRCAEPVLLQYEADVDLLGGPDALIDLDRSDDNGYRCGKDLCLLIDPDHQTNPAVVSY